MRYQVLISSTPRDRDIAENLAQLVREAGASVLSVEQTPPQGESIDFAFRRALKRSDELVVILTDRSLDNPYLLFEMGAAFSLRKLVIPILVGVEDSEITPPLAQFRYVKYSELRSYLRDLEKRAKPPAGGHTPVAVAN
jgi:hypothetical protein